MLDERCNAFDVVRPSLHGRVADDREQLSTTCDSAADLYQQARPDYPEAIVDTLVETTGVSAIGSSKSDALAGQPRSPLLVEAFGSPASIGPDLAAARRNLAGFPQTTVIDGAFESWRPRPDEQLGLVSAATARHWIDSKVRYRRAWGPARPGGRLAFWSATHVTPEDGGPFFAGIQAVCAGIGEGAPNE